MEGVLSAPVRGSENEGLERPRGPERPPAYGVAGRPLLSPSPRRAVSDSASLSHAGRCGAGPGPSLAAAGGAG